ncbi:MAG: cob(I)yrinic acid a,c-diamide adenosyltransferase [Planctomycetota bacterium]
MVYLSKIYTRTGDDGTTALGDGSRVPKTHPRIAAYGTVDELGAVIGVAVAAGVEEGMADILRRVQNDLFDLGADLCVPRGEAEGEGERLRVKASQVARLESEIDALNADLEPLRSFVLSGGRPAAAHLHVARCVARRAERSVLELARDEVLNPEAARYLNRLSDHLFVCARHLNRDGGEILWSPGGAS